MPRKRMISPAIWVSPEIIRLPRDARQLFIGMITLADDEGYGNADARSLRAAIFPADNDITDEMISDWLCQMRELRLAECHEVGRDVFYQLTGWTRNQSIRSDWKKKSEIRLRIQDCIQNPAQDCTIINKLINKQINIKESSHKKCAPTDKQQKPLPKNRQTSKPDFDLVFKCLKEVSVSEPTRATAQKILTGCYGKMNPCDLIRRAHKPEIPNPMGWMIEAMRAPGKYLGDGIRGWQSFVEEAWPKTKIEGPEEMGKTLAKMVQRGTVKNE